jgi:hypothetical protein
MIKLICKDSSHGTWKTICEKIKNDNNYQFLTEQMWLLRKRHIGNVYCIVTA